MKAKLLNQSRMFKKSILLVLLIIGQISCTEEKCDLRKIPFYDIQNIRLKKLKIKAEYPEGHFETAPFNETMVVTYDSLLIRLDSEMRFYTLAKPGFNFSLIPSAYACPPALVPGYEGTQEVVDTIIVTSLYDFDGLHPAGTNLNEMFNVSYYIASPAWQPTSMSLNAFLAKQGQQPPQQLNLRLNSKPDNQKQAFRMEYKFTNGENYILQTGELLIE